MSKAEITRGDNMAFTSKISQGELNSRGATTLPNTPSIGATALKQEFDAPAKVIVAPKHNSLIDELEGTTASANLGAVAPSGRSGATVQAVLNDLSSDLAVVEGQAHSHSNKTDCLDYLSDNEGTLNYKGQPISGGSSYTAGNGIQISNDQISAKLDSDTMEFSSGNIKAKNSHTHSNKALLDTYTQTESDLADAVTNSHTHSNKSVIDKFGESSGKPTYNGQPIGGGTEVTWNQITQSGTKIATVSIDGNSTDVYAPTGGGGGGATSLSGLDDVSLASIQNNQALMYDSATSKWKNKTIAISNVDGLQSELNAKASKSTVDGILDGTSIDSFGDVETALGNKVDKVAGKGLSKNDYTDADKAIVDGVTSALAEKSSVDANPTLAGTEDILTSLQVDGTKYKIQGGGGGYTLVITTNSALNGQMLTATKGSNTKRGLVASNQCRISLDEGGVWTIEEPINHHTVNTENLVYYGEYQYELKSYTIYGFHVDDSKSNPNPSTIHENDMVSYHVQYDGENVDNYNYDYGYMDFANDEWRKGSWSDNEFFMPRPVLLKQDFSDKIYLNPYDLTKDVDGNSVNDKLTGSTDGYNAMMEFGRNGTRIWYKVVPDATPTSYTVYVSDVQLDNGFHAWSFYDANDELMEHFYVAIYNGSNVSSVLRSLSGKSILNNATGTTEISYAKANRKNGETYSWYIDVYADRVLINFLMMLVIRSANSDRIGYGNREGGSSASNLLQTGLGNTKGFFYGEQSNGVVKVFGIENWFANQWRRCAGYSLVNGVIKYKLTYGTADGSSSSGYNESTSAPTNYLSGNSIATGLNGSAIVKEAAKTDGSLLPSTFGGSTSTNYCDSVWSETGTTFALVGGPCVNGAACGAFCVYLAAALSHASWNCGAALSCKPPAR